MRFENEPKQLDFFPESESLEQTLFLWAFRMVSCLSPKGFTYIDRRGLLAAATEGLLSTKYLAEIWQYSSPSHLREVAKRIKDHHPYTVEHVKAQMQDVFRKKLLGENKYA